MIEILTVVFAGLAALAHLANASAKVIEVHRAKTSTLLPEPPLVRSSAKADKARFRRAYEVLTESEPRAVCLLKRLLQPYLISTAIVAVFLTLSIAILVLLAITEHASPAFLLLACAMVAVLGFGIAWRVERILACQYEPGALRRTLYAASIWQRLRTRLRPQQADAHPVTISGLTLEEWSFAYAYLCLRRRIEHGEACVFAQEVHSAHQQLPAPTIADQMPIMPDAASRTTDKHLVQ